MALLLAVHEVSGGVGLENSRSRPEPRGKVAARKGEIERREARRGKPGRNWPSLTGPSYHGGVTAEARFNHRAPGYQVSYHLERARRMARAVAAADDPDTPRSALSHAIHFLLLAERAAPPMDSGRAYDHYLDRRNRVVDFVSRSAADGGGEPAPDFRFRGKMTIYSGLLEAFDAARRLLYEAQASVPGATGSDLKSLHARVALVLGDAEGQLADDRRAGEFGDELAMRRLLEARAELRVAITNPQTTADDLARLRAQFDSATQPENSADWGRGCFVRLAALIAEALSLAGVVAELPLVTTAAWQTAAANVGRAEAWF